jgi:hypothetical protein
VRTFPYPVLHSDDVELSLRGGENDEDKRVPWDVLVSLHDRMPNSDLVLGDFACIVLRVKELYAAASKWQQDISSLTMLSPRGGKRRAQNSSHPGNIVIDNPGDADATARIGVDKVIELSNSPILSKVSPAFFEFFAGEDVTEHR